MQSKICVGLIPMESELTNNIQCTVLIPNLIENRWIILKTGLMD